MSKKRGSPSRTKLKQDVATEIIDAIDSANPNPIRRSLKLKQFPWTAKQRDFFKIALAENTKIMLVKGPAVETLK